MSGPEKYTFSMWVVVPGPTRRVYLLRVSGVRVAEQSQPNPVSGTEKYRVVIHNTLLNVTKIPESVSKNLEFGFLTALACSHDFLSMIFGFSMKFHVDIGGRKNFLEMFFRKFFDRKVAKKYFSGKF